MAQKLRHITAEDIATYGVVAAPDTLKGTPSENKAIFDRLIRELVAVAFNAAVDRLNEILESEGIRDSQETARQDDEAARVEAEKGRVEAEEGRVEAEGSRVTAEEAREAAEEKRRAVSISIIEQAAAEVERARWEADRAQQIAGGEVVTILELEGYLAQRAAVPIIGPAELVDNLLPGGILFITDNGNPEDYFLTMQQLLAEGYKSAVGEADGLETLLTPGRAAALNLRADTAGTAFDAGNINVLVEAIRNVSAAAVASGDYVMDGVLNLSWRQVQHYILHGELVKDSETKGEDWPWVKDPLSEVKRLRQEVENFRASVGEVVELTVPADSWSGTEAPYRSSLAEETVKGRNGIVAVSEQATETQRVATEDARIHIAKLADGSRVLEANEKPEMDLALAIIFL